MEEVMKIGAAVFCTAMCISFIFVGFLFWLFKDVYK